MAYFFERVLAKTYATICREFHRVLSDCEKSSASDAIFEAEKSKLFYRIVFDSIRSSVSELVKDIK